MNIKKGLYAGFAALALSMTAHAAPITVGGVTWDPDALFDLSMTSTLVEDQLDPPNGIVTLVGAGQIQTFNNTVNFCGGCELTYEFGGFDIIGSIVDGSSTKLGFTGGWINFYVDTTPDFDANNAASAGDGTLWLSLASNAFMETDYFISPVSLFASLSSYGAGSDAGNGFGYLDAVGGLAMGNFDTNTGLNGSDIKFNSTFNPLTNGATADGFELFGSADFSGDSIPEPSSIALLALGLLGFAARKKKA